MRHLTRRFAATAAATAVLAGATVLAAPAASAAAPGAEFRYGALTCRAMEGLPDYDGLLACEGTQAGYWRAKVKCTLSFSTYYGNWQNNQYGGEYYSISDSNCFWGVSDVSLSTT
ncbi:hypothetical protein [Saccharothrix syringae]|uniref:Uncharacterized protein n=1 Tax=Saccharothrix syringae TaxID=103733 RepID=A0A5Q0H238_SACSY|nr:hypothetical protein [Saccharothrix syringae]QFZ19880.1 hypothetical protein EKG83_22800 [Saccharothrix syringae]